MLWREPPSQEVTKKDPKNAVIVLKGEDINLFDGDADVRVDEFQATLTHLQTPGDSNPAHYRFSVRLKDYTSGRLIDWDPDVHDRPPKG